MLLDAQPGTTFFNPATGELARGLSLSDAEVVGEMLATPGAAVAGPHRHPRQQERFEVLAGVMGVRLGDERFELRAGQSAVVPVNAWHDWWNAGEETLHVRATVTPAGAFVDMIAAVWGLAALGRTGARGKPKPLDVALLLEAFGDEIIFEKPPLAVQRALARVVAPVARRLGRSVVSEEVLRASLVPASRWPLATAP